MYTRLKNVQTLLGTLKNYGIRHIVLSPGGCDFPIVRSIECDDFFKCYSVVDESSSPYVASGISEEINEPVAVVCTSGTAAINFVSGIKWAFNNNKRIVAITADRDPVLLGQMETQKIEQLKAFDKCTCQNIQIPHITRNEDFYYCERILNEAFISLIKKNRPIHINVPTTIGDSLCVVDSLPKVRKIDIINEINQISLKDYQKKLIKTNRVLIIIGQTEGFTDEVSADIEGFAKKIDAVIAVDHLSNFNCESNLIHYYRVAELISKKDFAELCPKIVITIGNNYAGERIKRLLRERREEVEHWSIDSRGRIRDVFYCLQTVFQCNESSFFDVMNSFDYEGYSKCHYYDAWNKWEKKIIVSHLPYSSFLVARQFCETVPANSNVYLSILMAIRQTQFFDFKSGVKVSSNVGALGIDGCTSTFIGGSDTENFCFLLVGDLSYFYDITSGLIKDVNKNVRIVLINNHCGGEFHFTSSNSSEHSIDNYVAAGHDSNLKKWVENLGLEYIPVNNVQELDEGFNRLAQFSEKPMFMEVFTDADTDAKTTSEIYSLYSSDAKKRLILKKVRKIGTRVIGEKKLMKLYETITRGGLRRKK